MDNLTSNGFFVFPDKGKFVLRKQPVASNPLAMQDMEFASYEAAVETANLLLAKPQLLKWEGIVRYNTGLGIEYKTLPIIESPTFEEATKEADLIAVAVIAAVTDSAEILEIRVRPKN